MQNVVFVAGVAVEYAPMCKYRCLVWNYRRRVIYTRDRPALRKSVFVDVKP